MTGTSHVLAHRNLTGTLQPIYPHITTSKLKFNEIKHAQKKKKKHAQGHKPNPSDFKSVLFSVPHCLSLTNYHYYYDGYASEVEGKFNGITMFVAGLYQNRVVFKNIFVHLLNKPYQCDNDMS